MGKCIHRSVLVSIFVACCALTPAAAQQQSARADSVILIQSLYRNLSTLNGQTVKVIGFYTSPQDPKLLTCYLDYLNRRPLPPEQLVFIDSPSPNPIGWHGGLIAILGTVSFVPNPSPRYGVDTALITITGNVFTYYLPGNFDPPPLGISEPETEQLRSPDLACDPCKFAILMSGGVSAADNNPGFWEDIEALYKYKTDPAGGNYCPENVEVLYYDGNSGDGAAIHDSLVDPCTEANIQAAHNAIAKKIADCERAGKKATVQKMVSNHGEDGLGFNTNNGTDHVSPTELRDWQQVLIDSCCDFLFDEFTQCYGGDMVDGLKGLDDKNKTEIHGNSAAGGGSCGWGDESGSPYLMEKIKQLRDSADYEDAVRSAKGRYESWLDTLRDEADSMLALIDSIRNSLPPGDPDLPELDSIRQEWQDLLDDLTDSLNDPPPSFVRYIFKEYCEWKKIVVQPGGQFKLTFKGTGGCGNVSVYCELPDGTKRRIKVWNWNLPGSNGYTAGNNERVFNADPTGNGIYWIHNDNGEFSVTVEPLKTQTLPESPSNQSFFAGFSAGGRDSSAGEFRTIISPTLFVPNADALNFDLTNLPTQIGNCGVGIFGFSFTAAPNPYWADMELWIRFANVLNPGFLQYQCPTAEIASGGGPVDNDDSEVVFPLGAIAPGMGQMQLFSSPGMCLTIDCWGLRSRVPTFPEYICGDADGNSAVSIADVVFLINYIFAGGPAPNPLQSGDADCSGGISIADAVYIINYIFSGGAPPCAMCK